MYHIIELILCFIFPKQHFVVNSIHVATSTSSSLLLTASKMLNPPIFTYSPGDGCSDCFQFPAITNNCKNILGHVLMDLYEKASGHLNTQARIDPREAEEKEENKNTTRALRCLFLIYHSFLPPKASTLTYPCPPLITFFLMLCSVQGVFTNILCNTFSLLFTSTALPSRMRRKN